ncbi:hypothetical protein [Kineosporia succinea]|uniref:HicB-like protein involved in pilus formation n=1 Tax=Kineosporia succinea TaxID=84632 RepID=A0ABT9P285_9ACTN|nr:hypothetical protein [Kineosporia succinea]MDP9826798.1 hypothetical protein [Kineosporia succinea]
MDVTAYTARLHRDLYAAGQVGGDESLVVAEHMANALDSSIRLVLLDALVEAAGEISEGLAPGSVEVRLLGREVQFAVSAPVSEPAAPAAVVQPPVAADDPEDDGATARLSLRLPERLKSRVEEAASAAGLSVNAWLVRSVGALVENPTPGARPAAGARQPESASPPLPPTWSGTGMGQRRSGWVR